MKTSGINAYFTGGSATVHPVEPRLVTYTVPAAGPGLPEIALTLPTH